MRGGVCRRKGAAVATHAWRGDEGALTRDTTRPWRHPLFPRMASKGSGGSVAYAPIVELVATFVRRASGLILSLRGCTRQPRLGEGVYLAAPSSRLPRCWRPGGGRRLLLAFLMAAVLLHRNCASHEGQQHRGALDVKRASRPQSAPSAHESISGMPPSTRGLSQMRRPSCVRLAPPEPHDLVSAYKEQSASLYLSSLGIMRAPTLVCYAPSPLPFLHCALRLSTPLRQRHRPACARVARSCLCGRLPMLSEPRPCGSRSAPTSWTHGATASPWPRTTTPSSALGRPVWPSCPRCPSCWRSAVTPTVRHRSPIPGPIFEIGFDDGLPRVRRLRGRSRVGGHSVAVVFP